MTFLINQLCFAVINIIDAWVDKGRIKNNVKSSVIHWTNAVIYTSLVVIISFFTGDKSLDYMSLTFIAAFFNRQIFFDVPLNLFRGLKWDYVTESESKSFTEKLEIKLIGNNGKAQTIIYTQSFLLTILIYFL